MKLDLQCCIYSVVTKNLYLDVIRSTIRALDFLISQPKLML